MKKKFFLLLLFFFSTVVCAQEAPIPRFASLRSDKINLRAGPGERFPIEWVYECKNLPVEIIDAYEHWYKIKDYENIQGWMHKKMVSKKRYVLTPKGKKMPVYKKADISSPIIAYFDGQAVVQIVKCKKDSSFCLVSYNDWKGYIERTDLFGLYPKEEIK